MCFHYVDILCLYTGISKKHCVFLSFLNTFSNNIKFTLTITFEQQEKINILLIFKFKSQMVGFF